METNLLFQYMSATYDGSLDHHVFATLSLFSAHAYI